MTRDITNNFMLQQDSNFVGRETYETSTHRILNFLRKKKRKDTHPLVPSIGSKTQCRPTEPPSDLPPSMAASTSSVVKVEKLFYTQA